MPDFRKLQTKKPEEYGDIDRCEIGVRWVVTVEDIAPYMSNMCDCGVFKYQFGSNITSITSRADVLSIASVTIRKSKKFAKVLQLVLSLGNSLNQKKTKGFRLSSLLKLTDTRSTEDT